jgi:hypothetical protein
MASLLYPRTIAVHRAVPSAATNTTVGLVGYSGMTTEPAAGDTQGETVLFTNIPASIQAAQIGRKKGGALPSDVVLAPTWDIYIPASALARGSVKDRDVILDDEGIRYQVGQAYWEVLGYKLVCIRLEA